MTADTAPKLLFLPDETEFSSSADAMSDLKLAELLPEGTAELLRLRPNESGSLQRRELFGSLLHRTEAVPQLERLEELLSSASQAKEYMDAAPCENGKAYVFPEFAARMLEFCHAAAADRDYGRLYASFSRYFKETAEGELIKNLSARLASIGELKKQVSRLTLEINGDNIKASAAEGATMLSNALECARNYGIDFDARLHTRQISQPALIDSAAKLFPHEFADIVGFYREFRDAFPAELSELIPQLRLARGIVELTQRAQRAGLPYCFPEFTDKKELCLFEVYDPALLLNNTPHIVPNDVHFDQDDPFFYLTGANGGGKTTYLRAVGSAAVLFMFGAPVFCRSGHGCLLEGVQTHFPRDERFEGSGRFVEEKSRVDAILERCRRGNSPRITLVLLNETYSTTSEDKAKIYTSELARTLHESGSFGLYITHQHSHDEQSVPFLGVTVDETDANRRTYRIERRRLSSRSFAADVLLKYGITREALERKLSGRSAATCSENSGEDKNKGGNL